MTVYSELNTVFKQSSSTLSLTESRWNVAWWHDPDNRVRCHLVQVISDRVVIMMVATRSALGRHDRCQRRSDRLVISPLLQLLKSRRASRPISALWSANETPTDSVCGRAHWAGNVTTNFRLSRCC